MLLKMPLPGGTRVSGCRGCGEVFSSLTAFDQHRRGFQCRLPSECGLVYRLFLPDQGLWALPGGDPRYS